MKSLFAGVLLIALCGAAYSQVTCQTYGNTTNCNGSLGGTVSAQPESDWVNLLGNASTQIAQNELARQQAELARAQAALIQQQTEVLRLKAEALRQQQENAAQSHQQSQPTSGRQDDDRAIEARRLRTIADEIRGEASIAQSRADQYERDGDYAKAHAAQANARRLLAEAHSYDDHAVDYEQP